MILYPHLSTNELGHLTIGGLDTVELAREFGTPAYIMDEDVIRQNMREYLQSAEKHFGCGALPLFASKSFCCTEIYKIAAEEGLTNGYRLVSNCGPDACQTVPHLHFHILGGTKLTGEMA